MRSRGRLIAPILIIGTFLLVSCEAIGPQQTPMPTFEVEATPTKPEIDLPAIPPEIQAFAAEWPMANRDYSNTRATMDAAINSENISELSMAWTFELTGIGHFGAAASNPLIANGIVYVQDLASNVFALDFESGDVIWQREYGQAAVGPNGPAIGWGKLFMQGGEDNLIALDLESGEELWTIRLHGPAGAHQPYLFSGYVITGIQAGSVDFKMPGHVISSRG